MTKGFLLGFLILFSMIEKSRVTNPSNMDFVDGELFSKQFFPAAHSNLQSLCGRFMAPSHFLGRSTLNYDEALMISSGKDAL